jgi:phosphatidylserine/phosphatidylglycerophosphate/cardiolipin synthase-like enzyme
MTDALDLGSLIHADGFFLVRKNAGQPGTFVPTGADAMSRYRHVFTYEGSGTTIKELAVELIRSAREKIFVASFLLGEADLLDALFSAAERMRGGVYVISELSERTLRQQLAELEDSPDPDSSVRAHKKNFAELTRRGVAVRGRPDCHAKFMAVDDRAALVSSANLDTRGLNSTGENGAVITDAAEVDRLARFFTRLWDSCSFEMPAGSDHYSVRERAPQPSRCRVPKPEIAAAPGIIWTDGGERLILGHLHDLIARARRSLLLATFSLNDLTGHPDLLLQPLAKALRANPVRASLLCRGRNNVRSHRHDAATLHDLGVRIYADSLNHAKGVIADDEHGALFSANFDADHGLLDGVETGIRLDGQPALAEAAMFFRHSMENADLEYVRHPTGRQMDQGLAARWRTAWPYGKQIRVAAREETWRQFRAEASVAPVLYSRETQEEVRLYAGNGQWLLSPPRVDGTRDLTPADTGPSWADERSPRHAAGLLEYWLSPPRRSGKEKRHDPTRGICPATFEWA